MSPPNRTSLFFVALLALSHLGGADRDEGKPDLPPTTLEVDLIFPRPGETHYRATPLPIVFAIQGAKNLWPYNLVLKWYLDDLDDLGTAAAIGGFEDIGYGDGWTEGAVPDGEDPFLYISTAPVISVYNSTRYALRWEAYLPDNCTKAEVEARSDLFAPVDPTYRDTYSEIRGGIRFNVSNDAGLETMRMELEGDACPDVDSFLEGQSTQRIGGTVGPSQCIFFDEEDLHPEPNPCAARVDSAMAARITQEMVALSHCRDRSWPGEISEYCAEEEGDEEGGAEAMAGSRSLFVVLACAVGGVLLGSGVFV